MDRNESASAPPIAAPTSNATSGNKSKKKNRCRPKELRPQPPPPQTLQDFKVCKAAAALKVECLDPELAIARTEERELEQQVCEQQAAQELECKAAVQVGEATIPLPEPVATEEEDLELRKASASLKVMRLDIALASARDEEQKLEKQVAAMREQTVIAALAQEMFGAFCPISPQ